MIKPLKRGFKMAISLKCSGFLGLNILIIIIIAGVLSPFWTVKAPQAETDLLEISISENFGKLATIEGNSLLPIADFSISRPELQPTQKIKVVVTAYSSTPWETWGDPFITAAGTWVRDGVVANNILQFGTKIRIPELYGDKIFVVEDRMSWTKGNYQIDIWFPSYGEALNFGTKRTYIEILES